VRSACHNALIRGLGLRLARRRRTTIGRQRATQSTWTRPCHHSPIRSAGTSIEEQGGYGHYNAERI